MANWRHQAITYMAKKIRRNNSKYISFMDMYWIPKMILRLEITT